MPEAALPPATHPTGLADVAARLRAEWRADEEAWTDAAAQTWVRSRSLTDVLGEYAARGDRVVVEIADVAFAGTVTAVGDDRVDLTAHGITVTVHTAVGESRTSLRTPLVIRRSTRAPAGGVRLPTALSSFAARLRELDEQGATARVGLVPSGRELVGTLAVASDHVVVRSDVDVVVPTCWIGYVLAIAGAGS